jgi:prolactin regulatory element-binding protein
LLQEIYEIYHNGRNFIAEEVIRHETGPSVVMNFDIRNGDRRSLLVAGQESHCQMYFVNTKIVDDNEGDLIGKSKKSEHVTATGVRQRRTSERNSMSEDIPTAPKDINANNNRRIRFEVKPGDSVQTDFMANEPLQRMVRISPNGNIMATGGLDGFVRLWHFPKMQKITDIKAHTKEIDDLDFSPDNKYLVSLSKDGLAMVWSANSGKKASQLMWQPPEGTKYLFKRCRFGEVEGQKEKYRLFTLANPLGKSGKRQRGYLQCWDTETGKLNRSVGIDESLSALAVRDDGRFVAVGSMFSGSVSIYIAFSLQVS